MEITSTGLGISERGRGRGVCVLEYFLRGWSRGGVPLAGQKSSIPKMRGTALLRGLKMRSCCSCNMAVRLRGMNVICSDDVIYELQQLQCGGG